MRRNVDDPAAPTNARCARDRGRGRDRDRVHPGIGSHRPEEPGWRDRIAQLAETTDGSAADDKIIESVDRVAAFNPAILAIRWSTTVASLALSAQHFSDQDWSVAAACGVVIAYTVFRTLTPIRYLGDVKSLLRVLAEVPAVHRGGRLHRLLGVAVHLLPADGRHRGRVRPGLRLRHPGRPVRVVRRHRPVPDRGRRPTRRITFSAECTVVLLLVALIAGYARRISGEADRQHSLALDRLGPPRRRQRPALLPAPGHPDPAGLARPRRRPRHDARPPARPLRLRLRRHPGVRRHRRHLAGRPHRGHPVPRRADARARCPGPLKRVIAEQRRHQRQQPADAGGPGLAGRASTGPLRRAPGPRLARSASSSLERQADRALHRPRRRAAQRLRRAGRRWPSTTPAGSAGCAPSAPTRSAPASPATCTTASASPSPTSPSSSTAS